MLDSAFNGVAVSGALLDRLAEQERMTPAEAVSTAQFARHIGAANSADSTDHEKRILRRVDLSARAQGANAIGKRRASPLAYDLKYLNLDCRLAPDRMIEALGRNGSGTLCFYGMPGTGKTALAEHIAKALNRKLIVKTYSSLASMWVGESEKNIAAAFQQASEEEAVLLLDEADSFLMDRSLASARWQVTETNEFLARMERFDGIFICTTNLFEDLDAAVLRRFDFKVGFKALAPGQLTDLLNTTFAGMAWEGMPARIGRVAAAGVAPGDVMVVCRQIELAYAEADANLVLELLMGEVSARRGSGLVGRTPMGFTAT